MKNAVLFLLALCSSAAPQPTAGGQEGSPPPGLSGLDLRLDEALKSLAPASAAPDYYVAAKGKIHETQVLLVDDPQSENRPGWMRTCSLYVEAATLQMQAIAAGMKRSRALDERVEVLAELGNSLDEINKLERGYASSLRTDLSSVRTDLSSARSDLEEQKRKVKEAREEAEKRFNELNSALIQVKKDARGTIISMSDILFAVGKADLTVDLKTSLAKIAGILTIYKDANVVVEGHTDNQGTADFNQKLSEKRASNVMDFLVNPGGIDAKRLSSVGYGFTKPIADNETKEGRQKNRRVDLVISDKPAKGP